MVAALLWASLGISRSDSGASRLMKLPVQHRVDGRPLLGSYNVDDVNGIARMAAMGMNLVLGGEEHLDPAKPLGSACAEHNVRVLYHLTQHIYGKPRLAARVTPSQTTIPLYTEGAGAFPKQGTIQLDDEVIVYEDSTENTLLRCHRGSAGTKPAAHRVGTILFWPDQAAAEIGRVRSSPNLWGYYVLDDSPGDALSALTALYRIAKRLDPGRVVAAGYGSAGSLCNFGPGVCDLMLVYWYPVFASGNYDPLLTSHQVQWMMAEARRIVPGIPFAGVYQTFDAAFERPENLGKGLPTPEQLRKQMEDFVREGACGLIAYLGGVPILPGWETRPALQRVIQETNAEIRAKGGLLLPPEPPDMAAARTFPMGFWSRASSIPGIPPAWHVILPFGPTGAAGLDAQYPPDREIRLDAEYPSDQLSIGWIVRRTIGGVIGLGEIAAMASATREAMAYATCEVISPAEQKALLACGSDDDMIVRLNGEEIVRRVYAGGLKRDAERWEITLRQGVNRLFVKVHNRAGMWGFQVRLLSKDGQPLRGLRFSPAAP